MIETAYILCGGRGTRMGTISESIPKPMLPLLGKPVLEHILLQCKSNAITNICLITGHLGHVIKNYFKDGSRWHLSIEYFEEEEPLGTTGAFKFLENELPETFWIFYGDVIFDADLIQMVRYHRDKKAEMTIAVHPNDHPYDSDLIVTDSTGRVLRVHSKPHTRHLKARNLVNAALYLTEKNVIRHLPYGKSDWGRDQLPLLTKKIPVYAWRTTEYIKDIGTPDRIKKVESDLISGKPSRRNLRNLQKAIFLDRDGVLNKDIDLIHRPEQLKVYPYTARAVRKINQSDYLSIVVTNQSVVARGLVDLEGLDQIHAELDYALALEHAYLDDLYYCPHHPDKGYPGEIAKLKVECNCRKPAPGMLLQAAEKYNINLADSWIIGDRQADIEAGKLAGCQTVGVLTGNALKNIYIAPDFIFHNLEQAIDYIIEDPHKNPSNVIYRNFLHSDKRPYLIGIAGNTGSGKSTFATYLTKYFQRRNVKAIKIELDHWILAPEFRSETHDLREVYQIDRIEEDLKKIISGESIIPPGYKRHPTWKTTPPRYELTPDTDVLIVEGIVAFMPEILKYRFDYKVFCEATEQRFMDNLYSLNSWKGRSKEEIGYLIERRKQTEYQIIQKQKNMGDMQLTLK